MNYIPRDSELYARYMLREARGSRDERIEELMVSLIPHSEGLKVLDAGCAYGTLVAKIGRIHECWGIDISSELIHTAKETVKGAQFIVGDVNTLPFESETFDFVVSKNLLEHCRRPFDILIEFNRVLKNGGVIVCVPNEVNLASVLMWRVGDLLHPKGWAEFAPSDYHFYFWNRITLGALMRYAGFELKCSRALTFEFPLLGRLGVIGRSLARYFPTSSTPVIIKGRKSKSGSFFDEIKYRSNYHKWGQGIK